MNRPWRITIDTNPDQCNLNCIMCDTHSIYNTEHKEPRKPMEKLLLEKSIDDSLKIGVKEIIPSTMGEPLMYKDFNVFVEKLTNTEVKLNLTTNGTFPIYGVEGWAKKLLPVLSDIKISINSLNPKVNEKIMPNDHTFNKIEAIKNFSKLRNDLNPKVTITLQVTFLESNLEELEELIIFAIENKLDRVKGHQLWITFDEINDESLQKDKTSIIRWNKFIDSVQKYRSKITLSNFKKIKLQENEINEKGDCPFLGHELWIDQEGTFNICCAPSNKRTALGTWGNIQNRTIDDMFNSKQYNNILQNYKSQSICKTCSLR
jgi:MoaA/NifB/PqqE/SkfB family radical SAM enzyme